MFGPHVWPAFGPRSSPQSSSSLLFVAPSCCVLFILFASLCAHASFCTFGPLALDFDRGSPPVTGRTKIKRNSYSGLEALFSMRKHNAVPRAFAFFRFWARLLALGLWYGLCLAHVSLSSSSLQLVNE